MMPLRHFLVPNLWRCFQSGGLSNNFFCSPLQRHPSKAGHKWRGVEFCRVSIAAWFLFFVLWDTGVVAALHWLQHNQCSTAFNRTINTCSLGVLRTDSSLSTAGAQSLQRIISHLPADLRLRLTQEGWPSTGHHLQRGHTDDTRCLSAPVHSSTTHQRSRLTQASLPLFFHFARYRCSFMLQSLLRGWNHLMGNGCALTLSVEPRGGRGEGRSYFLCVVDPCLCLAKNVLSVVSLSSQWFIFRVLVYYVAARDRACEFNSHMMCELVVQRCQQFQTSDRASVSNFKPLRASDRDRSFGSQTLLTSRPPRRLAERPRTRESHFLPASPIALVRGCRAGHVAQALMTWDSTTRAAPPRILPVVQTTFGMTWQLASAYDTDPLQVLLDRTCLWQRVTALVITLSPPVLPGHGIPRGSGALAGHLIVSGPHMHSTTCLLSTRGEPLNHSLTRKLTDRVRGKSWFLEGRATFSPAWTAEPMPSKLWQVSRSRRQPHRQSKMSISPKLRHDCDCAVLLDGPIELAFSSAPQVTSQYQGHVRRRPLRCVRSEGRVHV